MEASPVCYLFIITWRLRDMNKYVDGTSIENDCKKGPLKRRTRHILASSGVLELA